MQNTWPLIILALTAGLFAWAGIVYARRHRPSVEDYLSDRNRMGPHLATATVVASVAGAWVLFSPAETATWAGIAGLVGYAIGQAAPLIAFGLLGPRMRQLLPNGHSLSEYARHRYGRALHLFILSLMLFYMFVFLAAELTAIALACNLVMGTPLLWTALAVATATVAYTSYGGLRTSIFTDGLQFVVILPLLLVVFLVTTRVLGGFGAALEPVRTSAPALLSMGHGPGIEFGVTLIIAILAANMFHQGFWQRVYACRDERVLRTSFFRAGLVVMPLILLAGILGLMALGKGVAEAHSSVALFHLVMAVTPPWVGVAVLVLALALVMSSMDTLLNGMVSAITTDLAGLRPKAARTGLLRQARVLTVLLAVPAVLVAARGYSVLYLFLVADLVCAGAVFPVFYGMYSRRFNGRACMLSCTVGIAVGALFFPKPDFSPWLDIPFGGRFVVSFGLALGVSSLLAVVADRMAARSSRGREFDFGQLQEQAQLIEG